MVFFWAHAVYSWAEQARNYPISEHQLKKQISNSVLLFYSIPCTTVVTMDYIWLNRLIIWTSNSHLHPILILHDMASRLLRSWLSNLNSNSNYCPVKLCISPTHRGCACAYMWDFRIWVNNSNWPLAIHSIPLNWLQWMRNHHHETYRMFQSLMKWTKCRIR